MKRVNDDNLALQDARSCTMDAEVVIARPADKAAGVTAGILPSGMNAADRGLPASPSDFVAQVVSVTVSRGVTAASSQHCPD